MLTEEAKRSIDRIWDTFWANETTNPLTVVEQITFIIFAKLLDDNQIRQEQNANLLHVPLKDPVFKKGDCLVSEEPVVKVSYASLRWQNFKHLEPEALHRHFRDAVFPFLKTLGGGRDSAYSRYMADAQFEIHRPKVLSVAVDEIESMGLDGKDVMGDIYEELLDRVHASGENGQFRSPGNIIAMMVELMEPTPEDIVVDPAMGTAGFLIAVVNYLVRNFARELKNQKNREHFRRTMFSGFDIDKKMLRIGAMNLLLHGVEVPDVRLNNSIEPDAVPRGKYSLVLANPPFAGNMTEITVAPDLLAIANTKKTELLFSTLFTRILRIGGRCASIVPQGVLFGSSNAHVNVRKELVEHQKLAGVIAMPSGIFQPYSGVATAIVIFTKTDHGGTDDVFFYNMEADGFSLDQRREPVEANDIPDVIAKWRAWRSVRTDDGRSVATRPPHVNNAFVDRKAKCFVVPKADIVANNYDLSFNKYREVEYVKEEFPPTGEILTEIEGLIAALTQGTAKLKSA